MIYIVDNNIFSYSLKNIPFKAYQDVLYDPWSKLINEGRIISVSEVFDELEIHFGKKAYEMQWLVDNKKCFQHMTNDECKILMKIFENKKYREGIKEVSLRNGKPEADAMIVAKAKIIGAVVVTAESNKKPNSDKIPNMCVDFGVPYMKREDFYLMLRNVQSGKEELDNVQVFSSLEIEEED